MFKKTGFIALLNCLLATMPSTAQSPELLKDIYPQQPASRAFYLIPFGSQLLFTANDGTHGHAPWTTDGTPAGTQMLKDVLPTATGFEDFGPFWTSDGRAWFWAKDDLDVYTKLFLTDGTTAGTQLVDSMYGLPDVVLHQGWAVGDHLIFVQKDPLSSHFAFFHSDGTGAGTGPTGQDEPAVLGDILRLDSFYYQRLKPLPGGQGYAADLIRSDGTPAGTSVVMENATVNSTATQDGIRLYDIGGRLGYVRTKLLASAAYRELRVQGFPAVALSPGQYFGYNFTVLNDKLLYEAPAHPDSSASPLALYAFDGQSTEKLMTHFDIPFTEVAVFEQTADGRLFFRTLHPSDNQRIWATDGTAAGTHVLIDPATMPGLSADAWIGQLYVNEAEEEIYFNTVENQGKLCRFWSLDLADSTFTHLFDFNSVSPFGANAVWVWFNNAIVFTADDGLIGRELWKYQVHPVGVGNPAAFVAQKVEVSPNPANNFLKIRMDDDSPQTAQWILLDATGRTIQAQMLDLLPFGTTVGLGGLPPGIYFFAVRDSNGRLLGNGKICKQ